MTKTQSYAFLWLLAFPLVLAACAKSDAGASAAELPAQAAPSPAAASDAAALLEHQVRLSTINVAFEKKRPLLSIGGGRFGRAIKQAGVDAANVGAAIVVFTIRATGVFIPFAVLLLLPGFFALRWASRRFAVRRAAS